MFTYANASEVTRASFTEAEVGRALARPVSDGVTAVGAVRRCQILEEVFELGAYKVEALPAKVDPLNIIILGGDDLAIVPAFQFSCEGTQVILNPQVSLVNAIRRSARFPWEAIDFWLADDPILTWVLRLKELGRELRPLSLLDLDYDVCIDAASPDEVKTMNARVLLFSLASMTAQESAEARQLR